MCCCDKNLGKNGGAGNGAATVNTSIPAPPTQSSYAGCGNGSGVVNGAPFLVSPQDYANVGPIVSAPIVQRMGRQQPNNQYVFRPTMPGVVQVQSPKVGRY